jgi:hypothetical protein
MQRYRGAAERRIEAGTGKARILHRIHRRPRMELTRAVTAQAHEDNAASLRQFQSREDI